jgi:hypothetical protein
MPIQHGEIIMKKQLLWIMAGAIPVSMVVAVILGIMHTHGDGGTAAVSLSPEQALRQVKSGELEDLPAEVRQAAVRELIEDPVLVRDAMEDQSVTPEERDRLHEAMGEAFHEKQKEQMEKYFSLSPEERDAYLDEIVDQMVERMPPPKDSGAPPEDGKGKRHGPSMEDMKKRIESEDPVERAKQTEFHRVMREKMEARGQFPPGPK